MLSIMLFVDPRKPSPRCAGSLRFTPALRGFDQGLRPKTYPVAIEAPFRMDHEQRPDRRRRGLRRAFEPLYAASLTDAGK